MKKILSVLLVLSLTVSMMMSLGGCFKRNPFLGRWEAEMNLTEVFNNELGNDEAAKYLKVDELELKFIYTFKEDGTYKTEPDIEECNEAINELKISLRKGMEEYLKAEAAKQGIAYMGVDEILSYSNTTMDEIMETMYKEANFDKIIETLKNEGKYTVVGNKLSTTESLDQEIEDGGYELFEVIDDDEIKLTIPEEETPDELIGVYPIILEKID
ncbi:MAG: hypothetical protein IKT38_08035 [Clostridia bacterium]|nr:hypothetical protein [Clostridia bacterium]